MGSKDSMDALNKRIIHILGGREQVRAFIMLLRMACNLKLRNYGAEDVAQWYRCSAWTRPWVPFSVPQKKYFFKPSELFLLDLSSDYFQTSADFW